MNSGFDAVIKQIVENLKKYRNVITARESRLKKKHQPLDLQK